MSDEIIISIQSVYLFAITMGITAGGILSFCILLLRHRKGKAYELYSGDH